MANTPETQKRQPFVDNSLPQTSAGQAARFHHKITLAVIYLMVIVMIGVTIWLVRLSNSTEAELNQDATLNVPITVATSKAVTRKKEPERPAVSVPKRRRRPKDAPRRPLLVNPQPYQEPANTDLPSDRMVN